MPYSFFRLTPPPKVPVAECHQQLAEHLLFMEEADFDQLHKEASPLYDALCEAITAYEEQHGDLSYLHQAYAVDMLCGLIHSLAVEDSSDA